MVLAVPGALAQGEVDLSKVGTTAAPFLEVEVGARAAALGGAYVGLADEITAMYWNPGGLALLQRNEACFIHTQWLADLAFNYVAVAFPISGVGVWGASLTALDVGEMKVRTVTYPEGTGEKFSASSMALTVGFSRRLTDRFSIGGNFKIIQERIWHMRADGVAVDLGTMFVTPFRGIRLGMSVSNYGNKLRLEGRDTLVKHDIDPNKEGNNSKINAHLDTDYWSLPLIFRVGIAGDVLRGPHFRLTAALDADHPNNYHESIHGGLEFNLNNLLFLRVGRRYYINDLDPEGEPFSPEGWKMGGGVNFLVTQRVRLKIDYAYGDWGLLMKSQRFSLAVEF